MTYKFSDMTAEEADEKRMAIEKLNAERLAAKLASTTSNNNKK
jgi:NADH-quinone oxidoreductase subunit I